MVNPALLPGALSGLPAPDQEGPQIPSGRTKQAQLTFAATMAAVTGGCACQTCKLLRKAVAVRTEELTQELEQDAEGDASPA